MKFQRGSRTFLQFAMLGCLAVARGDAAFVTNGGSESGLTGWSVANQIGSEGTFSLQTGTLSPANGLPVPAPPGGTSAAMTDAQGPGSHALYQTFTVTSAILGQAFLEFDLFIANYGDAFVTPTNLNFATPALNQQARVDLLAPGADPFRLGAADVLLNAYRTQVGDPLVSGYTHYSVDVTSVLNGNLNTALTLRFAEVDNVDIFNFGVDNVNIVLRDAPAVPEPSSWLLAVSSVAVAGWRLRRKA